MAQLACLGVTALTVASGCGNSHSGEGGREGTDDDAPCWGLVEPMADPQSHAERTCNVILEHRTSELDSTFGAYARGGIPVYAGSVDATDSLGGELSGQAHAQIVRSDYIGIENQGPGALLQIVVPGSNRWLTLGQTDAAPETLIVGMVLEWDAWGSFMPTTQVDVRLAEFPATLDLTLHAENADATSTVELHLTKLAPSEFGATVALEFPNPTLGGYETVGDELRRVTFESGIGYVAERPADYTGSGSCGYNPAYSIEQYATLDDITAYGLRNAVLHDNSIACGSCQAEHCTWDYEKHLGTK